MNIGVLALQGAFIEHEKMLHKLKVDTFEIRQKRDLDRNMDALILPGGESTVIGKLLGDLEMKETIKDRILSGMPVFGTCAGMILLAKKIENDPTVHLGTMDIEVKRNAFGRQISSFQENGNFEGKKIPMVFIRAPYILNYGESVRVLTDRCGKVVAARQANQFVTAFHPELTNNLEVYRYFLTEVCKVTS